MVERSDQGVLNKVIGVHQIPGPLRDAAVGETAQERAIAPIQPAPGGFVASPHPAEQVGR